MALLYLLNDDIAVDEQGWEWDLVDGAWCPREDWQPPTLRLIVGDSPPPTPEGVCVETPSD
jgi:hypothetical protein